MYSIFLIKVCISFLLSVGFSYQYLATKVDDWRYFPPGDFVEIENKKIHFLCVGKNGPTVVLDAGLGADLNWWCLVQKEVSKFAQVCSFDRPGYGWSDTGKDPRTSARIVSELHDLLQAAQLKPPYILVGHSFGGANMRLYANTYPDDVIGLILVDACHENQSFEEDVSGQNVFATLKDYFYNSTCSHYIGITRWCMRESLDPFFSPLMSSEVRDIIIAKASSIKALRARDKEMFYLKESLDQLKKSQNTLLHKPLIIITAEETNKDPLWQTFQTELVELSNIGKQVIAEKSSHMVNVDRPEVIVDAVKEMIELCNNSSKIVD